MVPISRVPSDRILALNEAPLRPERAFVLYWCIAARRTRSNFGFQRAIELAGELGRPLVFLEALRCDYRWASDRHHRFVIQGMSSNRDALAHTAVRYWPYVEPAHGMGKGLIETLARDAAGIVTDDFPCFFLPRMLAAVAPRLDVRLEAVDGNGLFPMRTTQRTFTVAHSYRRFLHKELAPHLDQLPDDDPLAGVDLPSLREAPAATTRWPAAELDALLAPGGLAALPIDHDVQPVSLVGGESAGRARAAAFLAGLDTYDELRNHPDHDATSRLSPYLHFGHVAAHELLHRITEAEGWTTETLRGRKPTGKREGWWGLSASAEAFLEQLAVWREIGFNRCVTDSGYDEYVSLPGWARESLAEHAADPREQIYSLEQFETASTHDEVWNAAQRQLVREGRIHNYLRMLWGKGVLRGSASPRDALQTLIHLNDKYAVDGRDPNSYSGIFWCLGRYDRAWGPERPVFGKIRYMTSDSARKKLRMREYLRRYGEN